MSTSLITAQNNTVSDSVKIPRHQIKNIYIGLKQSEAYRLKYSECIDYSTELQTIISDQDKTLKRQLSEIKIIIDQQRTLNTELLQANTKLINLENRKIPWYKHPILYSILGLAGGIYIAK
jgi:hypothetical protein